MTDRIRTLVVLLERDMRDDDVEPLIQSISMMRGVESARLGKVVDGAEHLARDVARSELLRDLIQFVRKWRVGGAVVALVLLAATSSACSIVSGGTLDPVAPQADAGTVPDAAPEPDAGELPVDGGEPEDAAAPDASSGDANASPDTGAPDAGHDASACSSGECCTTAIALPGSGEVTGSTCDGGTEDFCAGDGQVVWYFVRGSYVEVSAPAGYVVSWSSVCGSGLTGCGSALGVSGATDGIRFGVQREGGGCGSFTLTVEVT